MSRPAAVGLSLPPGYRLEAFDSVGSTMDEARALAEAGAPDGTVVWAREQTAGRGRRGKTWSSPPGNLYLTLVLRPRGEALALAQLGFVAALALADAVEPLLAPGRRLRLKWPNDLLVNGAKVSGILLESQATAAGSPAWLLLGLGVNLATEPPDLPYPATSIAGQGPAPAPAPVLEAFLQHFSRWRDALQREGFGSIRGAWLARAAGVGESITARLPNRTLVGIFRDLDADGALLLDTPDGQRHRITAADLFFG